MAYSIAAILHPRKDKNGLQKVQIRIIRDRKKIYVKTELKVKEENFLHGTITGPKADKYNAYLRKIISDQEDNILNLITTGKPLKENKTPLTIFIHNYLDGSGSKYSHGSVKHYRGVANKVDMFDPSITLSAITPAWLQSFEKYLWGKNLDVNSVNNIMKRLKALLGKSGIPAEQYKSYKAPAYKQKIISYLTEDKIKKLHSLIENIEQPAKKMAGYYFLLCCYTGYRISDAKRFNKDMLEDGKIILRAKKNGQVVSIPVHTRLKKVLTYCLKNPFSLSEQKARGYIKEICGLAGIRQKVSFHTGRHSWAVMLMTKGFTVDEVAETLGDSPNIARIYAKIHNESLNKKIKERLG